MVVQSYFSPFRVHSWLKVLQLSPLQASTVPTNWSAVKLITGPPFALHVLPAGGLTSALPVQMPCWSHFMSVAKADKPPGGGGGKIPSEESKQLRSVWPSAPTSLPCLHSFLAMPVPVVAAAVMLNELSEEEVVADNPGPQVNVPGGN